MHTFKDPVVGHPMFRRFPLPAFPFDSPFRFGFGFGFIFNKKKHVSDG
jgi:hypothetical protein